MSVCGIEFVTETEDDRFGLSIIYLAEISIKRISGEGKLRITSLHVEIGVQFLSGAVKG